MRLACAVLCITCEEVFNEDEYKTCPKCTDKYPMRLLPILKPIKNILESKPNVQKSDIAIDIILPDTCSP